MQNGTDADMILECAH